MNTETLREFIRDLFTLRTVWIDRGGGKWTVKKRIHPLLRSALWTLALIVCAGIYSSIRSLPASEAEAQPEIITSKLIELDDIEAAPPVNAAEPQTILLPLKVNASKYEIILPSEADPSIGRIIKSMPRTEAPQIPENDGPYHIYVNKSEYTLSLLKGNELVKTYSIAVGKNPGDKKRVGDNRTPTGDFKIVSIENASTWSHNFRDGKGTIKGAYGPWFLRLDAKGWKGIGIHGTHDPDSRGTNATEGCIRLSNEDISELKQYAYKNMPVSIREE